MGSVKSSFKLLRKTGGGLQDKGSIWRTSCDPFDTTVVTALPVGLSDPGT
ncbi:hypothetical protein AB1P65_02370 [Roseibium alexandrii]